MTMAMIPIKCKVSLYAMCSNEILTNHLKTESFNIFFAVTDGNRFVEVRYKRHAIANLDNIQGIAI